MYIVVEVTTNMAEYGSHQSQQPENVNFEPIIFLTETKCKIRLRIKTDQTPQLRF